MAKKTKSLLMWCTEKQQTKLLSELNIEKISQHYAQGAIPDRKEYNSSDVIDWRCEKGHEWQCEIVGRTLFGLDCPFCYPERSILPVGTKYGCLTIIENNGSDIVKIEEEHNNTIRKYWGKNDYFSKMYKCQCKCGKRFYMNQSSFLKSRHKYCTGGFRDLRYGWPLSEAERQEQLSQLCGLAVQAENKKTAAYKRVLAKNYDIDFSGRTFESLEIIECVDDHYEKLTSYGDRRRKGSGTFTVYKLYRCRCYLCGKEQNIKCSDFHIEPPTEYGYTAYNGYWSGAKCDCHKLSSFQWMVNKLLFDSEIPYRVEVTFSGLLGVSETKLLQYDFAVYNKDGTIKCLIECQGEQHYKPVAEFGGERAYNNQLRNDERKRQYALEHNIKLIEISYRMKKYDRIKELLSQNGII